LHGHRRLINGLWRIFSSLFLSQAVVEEEEELPEAQEVLEEADGRGAEGQERAKGGLPVSISCIRFGRNVSDIFFIVYNEKQTLTNKLQSKIYLTNMSKTQ
jgi:hypothetical protein